MDDRTQEFPVQLAGSSALAASVLSPGFAEDVLIFCAQAARFRNFGAFFFSNHRHGKPALSIWSGSISDYWFKRNANRLLTDPARVEELRDQIRRAPKDGVQIRFWRPPSGDDRAAMYRRAMVYGRVSVSSRAGPLGLQSFFLRDLRDGAFTSEETSRLSQVLPFAHTMVLLRHHLIGAEAVQFLPGRNASQLRRRGVKGFAHLSEKEAEVCDAIAQGLSVAETARSMQLAESSVRTFRRRAYQKLGVHSSGEVAALILKDKAE